MLHQGGHMLRQNYTNGSKPAMYRCCVPGCAGIILNPANIKRVFNADCNAFHNTPDLVFVFHVELVRGWGIVCVPAVKAGLPIPGNTTPGKGGGGAAKQTNAAMLDLQLAHYGGNTRQNLRPAENTPTPNPSRGRGPQMQSMRRKSEENVGSFLLDKLPTPGCSKWIQDS